VDGPFSDYQHKQKQAENKPQFPSCYSKFTTQQFELSIPQTKKKPFQPCMTKHKYFNLSAII
jgi:hypothetical protein